MEWRLWAHVRGCRTHLTFGDLSINITVVNNYTEAIKKEKINILSIRGKSSCSPSVRNRATVPPVCCPLSDELFQQLANSVDPLNGTDSCLKGVDLYCKALEFCVSMCNVDAAILELLA